MKNWTLFTITMLVILGMGLLFTINITTIMRGKEIAEPYLKYNHVRGMAIEHNQLLYTLNFEQQTSVIDYINKAIRVVGVKPNKREKPPIDKIVVYQFDDKPDIVITPVAFINNNIVFSAPEWHHDAYLMEVSNGNFQQLLEQTYDH